MTRDQAKAAIVFIPWIGNPDTYHANAVTFDGTNDYMRRGAALTRAEYSPLLTLSMWLNPAADGVAYRILAAANTVGGGIAAGLSKQTSNQLVINFGTLNVASSNGSFENADGWVHALASFDMSNTSKRFLYVNDVSDLAVTTYTNAAINFTFADWGVGAAPDGNGKFDGDMADLLFWPGAYLDLSVLANRRLFIDAGGKPVDPDLSGGAVETLGTPIIRLTNPRRAGRPTQAAAEASR